MACRIPPKYGRGRRGIFAAHRSLYLGKARSLFTVGETNKGERNMKTMKITALKCALALAAVLAISGTGWAAKPTFAGPGVAGQFTDSTRTIVTVSVPVPQQVCQTNTATQTYSYSVKASILQPSGRILDIGFSEPTDFNCLLDQNVNVTITAIQGLSFKPGPATLIYQVTLLSGY
jgi:hypothetical protein